MQTRVTKARDEMTAAALSRSKDIKLFILTDMEARGMNKQQIANALGVTWTQVNQWLDPSMNTGIGNVILVAEAVGLTLKPVRVAP